MHEIKWVHVFEQDTPAGSTFLRADADLPLSRRPRLGFVLHADGTAEIFTPDANDQPSAKPARWVAESDEVLVRRVDGSATLRIIEQHRDRLVVQILAE